MYPKTHACIHRHVLRVCGLERRKCDIFLRKKYFCITTFGNTSIVIFLFPTWTVENANKISESRKLIDFTLLLFLFILLSLLSGCRGRRTVAQSSLRARVPCVRCWLLRFSCISSEEQLHRRKRRIRFEHSQAGPISGNESVDQWPMELAPARQSDSLWLHHLLLVRLHSLPSIFLLASDVV